jgi:hypothetical protein
MMPHSPSPSLVWHERTDPGARYFRQLVAGAVGAAK